MLDLFVKEFEEATAPCDRFRKHGESLVKFKKIEPDIFRVQNLIAIKNPHAAIKTIKFLCNLADKHQVTITGMAQPALVGPSITNQNKFFVGLDKERLVKLYEKYGFESSEVDGKITVTRRPRNED